MLGGRRVRGGLVGGGGWVGGWVKGKGGFVDVGEGKGESAGYEGCVAGGAEGGGGGAGEKIAEVKEDSVFDLAEGSVFVGFAWGGCACVGII